jgi:ribosomal protein S18 acetylase RimI-like enzyme
MSLNHEFVIRKAEKTDIPIISRLAHEVWPGAYGSILSPAQIKYMLDLFYAHESLERQFDEEHVFLLAFLNEKSVGFASWSHANKAGVYKVHKLYVHPELQGRGIGKNLLDEIANQVKSLGAHAIQLDVNRHNPAKVFYEKYGFKVAGEKDTAIGEGFFMNDYVMEKSV